MKLENPQLLMNTLLFKLGAYFHGERIEDVLNIPGFPLEVYYAKIIGCESIDCISYESEEKQGYLDATMKVEIGFYYNLARKTTGIQVFAIPLRFWYNPWCRDISRESPQFPQNHGLTRVWLLDNSESIET